MSRIEVHAESGHRLGVANPYREGPADLRLVGPALGAWAGTAASVNSALIKVSWCAVLCLAVAGVLVAPTARRALRRRAAGGRAVATERGDGVWRYRGAVAGVLACAAAGIMAGGLHAEEARRGPLPGLAREFRQVTVELVVGADPRPTRAAGWGGASVAVDAEVERVLGADGGGRRVRTPVLVLAPADWQGLLPSTRVRVTARLAPGDGRIAAVLRAPNGPPHVTGAPTALQRMAGELRGGLRSASQGLAPDARALLPGLVVGDTSRVTPELRAAFRATDLTHLMAVSGSNLMIVLALLIGPPGRALLAERGGLAPRLGISLRTTAVLGGALTLAFVVVCRPEPSVVRAAACGLVALLAIGTGRRRSLIPALAAVVLLLVLYAPELARSYGFLLSVLATGALLTIAPGWSAALRRRGVPARLAEVLAAAAAAQAVCAPVVAVFAARVSLVAVPCNLLAEPAVALATVAGFAALAAAPIAMPAAESLAWCASWPTRWIASVARTGAALPGAEWGWPGGRRGGALLAALTAVLVLVARRLPRCPWVAAALALVLLLAVVRPAPLTRIVTGWPPPGWAYAVCDVGQGDATVLAAGAGSAVVIDAGPEALPVDRCLHELGVTRIPLLLLTHFHADHVGGLTGVLRGRSVGVIETTGFAEPPDQVAFVRRTAAARGVAVTTAAYGERRALGGLSWEVLWPPPEPGPVADGPNDASVTLLVHTAAGLSLLLPGDLEPPAQRRLLRRNPALGRVDVLKVAHHGSAHQDPGLLRLLRPRLALISVGLGNRYGHPAPGTIAVLRTGGAAVLRTDTDGAIAITGVGDGLRAVPRGHDAAEAGAALRGRDP
ncbi:ComEC/Rec2 family competence protein [Streptomyces sp. NBC_00083]|uniref:ComEC/Rec2 family competence protein n=1 Tax=Streptomyces sp. NBC_00083 TaxID=2975647 RepID=UPI002253B03D|nr:ComEC/Rec2 family competence protein [Streptomyces sp. NBC_00083]MCX5382489.1 ComEC/Rec2 family competence protein [Streptomyces sp. NBC_00083]